MQLLLIVVAIGAALARPQGDNSVTAPPNCQLADRPTDTTVATTKNPNCGSTQNGQTVEKGRYYYTCDNGDYKPMGCLDTSKKHIAIGETFTENGYVIKCVLTATQDLTFEFASCMIGGKAVGPDETAEGASDANWFWYKCTKMPDGRLQAVVAGCMSGGKRLNMGERIMQGGYMYECRKEPSTKEGIALWPVACFDETSQKAVDVGQTFTGSDKNLYECVMDTTLGMIEKRIRSCLTVDGKQVKDGETFRDGDTIKKCYLGVTTATIVSVGCAGPADKPQPLNAVWLIDSGVNPSLKIEVTCQSAGAANATMLAQTGCVYMRQVGGTARQMRIAPGCFIKVDEAHAAGCKAVEGSTPAKLTGFYFELTKLDTAVSNKLSLCS